MCIRKLSRGREKNIDVIYSKVIYSSLKHHSGNYLDVSYVLHASYTFNLLMYMEG